MQDNQFGEESKKFSNTKQKTFNNRMANHDTLNNMTQRKYEVKTNLFL